jgi:hypothetical protein
VQPTAEKPWGKSGKAISPSRAKDLFSRTHFQPRPFKTQHLEVFSRNLSVLEMIQPALQLTVNCTCADCSGNPLTVALTVIV